MYAIEILPFITFPILITLLLLWCTYKSAKNKRFPPSPPNLPILGNLHQLSSLPHQDLHAMARKHGPLMLLHFGSVPVLIVSSADAAIEIMKTHDLTFASRPEYKTFKKLSYGGKDVAFSPYGEYWRQMKSIFVLQLLSNKRVQSFRSIREEETAIFVRKIGEFKGLVNLSEMFGEFTNDVICRSAFGSKFRESENRKELLRILEEFMALLGAICIGDFIPWLSWIDRVSGFDKKLDRASKAMDDFLENLVRERIEASKGSDGLDKDGQNFVDIMLQIHDENKVGASITRDDMKALLVDVLAGGTDTISTTLEWAMTELLRHPIVLEKLQNEVREIAEDNTNITDNDLVKMHYLKAVIKETLRYHPPLPLLVPRVASKDVRIKGYDILAGTVTMINVWTIGRDAATWDDAEKFRPERFLESSIDFKGVDFELIPFGAGRRGCPGITYAVAAMEFLLANIVQKFNWKLGNGAQGIDLDTIEAPGIAVHRANPLFAVATKSA
ncbi:cytochrome P450 [Perilla frutescens var. hirtella]|uniref:Cytochrome P450 n=1 Tax=Perilla frutescens var. hirtella TaxID=608512 RepID=A0AAD4JAA1_PERFH|nr:cytochrome P450 [Perilla frutescens var. hirtella]